MPTERTRLVELAIESLEAKRKQIDEEINTLRGEIRGFRGKTTVAATRPTKRRKRSRFTKEERLRRSQRMKAYWEKWRKQRATKK